MKKLFGRSKTKEKPPPEPAAQAYPQQPPQAPAPFVPLPPQQQQQWNPYHLYAPSYPAPGQYYPTPSPFPAASPVPPAGPPLIPPGSPPTFTNEQLAMFTPEQRAQILQWAGQATSPPPLQFQPTPAFSSPIPSISPPIPSISPIPAPTPQIAAPTPTAPPSTLPVVSPPLPEQHPISSSPSYSVPPSAPPPQKVPIPPSTPFSSVSPPQPGAPQPSVASSSAPSGADASHAASSAALLKDQANSLLKSGDYDGAITYYTLALDYTPNSAIILANRSIAYFSLHPPKLDEAITDARKAVENDATYWKAWSRLGQYLVEKGQAREAKEALEKAITLGGDQVTTPTRRALEKANDMIDAERMTTSVSNRTYASPSSNTAPLSPTTETRTSDVPTTSDDLPGYAPNFSSTDPGIRALSAQALMDQVNAMTDHLKIKNKGAVVIRTLNTSGNIKGLQIVYSYMLASELTARETLANIQPLHPSFAQQWIDRVTIPGSTYLDMDMESSKLYAGKLPGTVGMSGYSEEYRASKLPTRLNLMLCNYDPLPTLSTDVIISQLRLILLGLPQSIDTAEKELRELLPPRRPTTVLTTAPTWQSQITELCYALNRNEPTSFVDLSQSRYISNNTLGGPTQGIGLSKFLYQILLGAQLLRRLWKEPVNIDYSGLVTDPISALLVIVNQWMQNVDITKSTTIPAGATTPKYLLVSRVHQKQSSSLLKFAELISWPFLNETRAFIENAYNGLISGTMNNFDLMDWLFGLIGPGKVYRHRIMSCLVMTAESTKTFGGAPYYDSGIVLPSKSYWPQKTVLGRVLGGLGEAKSVCGWVGPVPRPTLEDGEEMKGWVVVSARAVDFPEPCEPSPGDEEDWLDLLINSNSTNSSEDVIRELTNLQSWISPTLPNRTDSGSTTLKSITFAKLPIIQTTNEQQYRPSLNFTINSSAVSYTLYTNPVFTAAHPCVGSHVMHAKDVQKYTQHVHVASELKDLSVPDNELLIINVAKPNEEAVARAWCAERGRHAVVRRGPGCCLSCAMYMASGRRGLGGNVLIWS